MSFLSVSLNKVCSCIKIELVLCVSSPLKVLFFQSILSSTSVTILSSSILFETNFDWFSLHSAHLSSINLVSVYDSPCPILCESVITSLESVVLYILSDNCERDGFAFGIKVSISSQILEILVALTLDNFTVPFSSKVELGLTIDVIRLNKVLLLVLMFFSSSMSCGVGDHWRFSLESLRLQLSHNF